MKKLGVFFVVITMFGFAGCASLGGSSSGTAMETVYEPYSVNLGTLSFAMFSNRDNSRTDVIGVGVRNVNPFPRIWDGVLFIFPEITVDVTKFTRITIRANYYDANGDEIPQGDSNAMVVLINDVTGDLKGPEMVPGNNTPLKEFNIGGSSCMVSTDRGTKVFLTQAPGGVLLQASSESVKFIEITEVTFHN
jgi:hypothetical protein